MRTLRQIDNELMDAAKKRADELCGASNEYCGITKNEVVAMQANARMGDKFHEMYHLLAEIESFLTRKWEGPTGSWDEDTFKKFLIEKIGKV